MSKHLLESMHSTNKDTVLQIILSVLGVSYPIALKTFSFLAVTFV